MGNLFSGELLLKFVPGWVKYLNRNFNPFVLMKYLRNYGGGTTMMNASSLLLATNRTLHVGRGGGSTFRTPQFRSFDDGTYKEEYSCLCDGVNFMPFSLAVISVGVLIAYVMSVFTNSRTRKKNDDLSDKFNEALDLMMQFSEGTNKTLEVLNERIEKLDKRNELLETLTRSWVISIRSEILDHVSRFGSGFIGSMTSMNAENNRVLELLQSTLLSSIGRINELNRRIEWLESEVAGNMRTVRCDAQNNDDDVNVDGVIPEVDINGEPCPRVPSDGTEEFNEYNDRDHKDGVGDTQEVRQMDYDHGQQQVAGPFHNKEQDICGGDDGDSEDADLSSMSSFGLAVARTNTTDEEAINSGGSGYSYDGLGSAVDTSKVAKKMNSYVIQLNFQSV